MVLGFNIEGTGQGDRYETGRAFQDRAAGAG